MKRPLLLAALVLVVWVPGAEAHTTIIEPPGSHYPFQRWVDEAKVPTPDVTLKVIEEPCPDPPQGDIAAACTENGTYIIWDASQYEARQTFLHELGHNFDYYVLPGWARERFQRLTTDTRSWEAEPNGPVEHFADAYARCAITGARFHGDPNLLIKPHFARINQATYRRICRMIERVG